MDDALHILLKRYRRRLMLARAIRRLAYMGTAAAGACVAASIVQRLTGMNVLGATVWTAGVVGLLGWIWGMRRWPTLSATALEIDRQADLRELLSSALSADDDAFARSVAATGRQRAEQIELEKLGTGGYAPRAWIALLIVLGTLPLVYAPVQSDGQPLADASATGQTATERSDEQTTGHRSQRARITQRRRETSGSNWLVAARETNEGKHGTSGERHQTRSDTTGTSAGGGLAQSGQATPATPIPAMLHQQEHGTGADSGSGMASANPAGEISGEGAVFRSVHEQAASNTAPIPLQPAAASPLDARSIPEAYRDVLKAYFAR